jgi:parvulin-like peptidyl-prolyl isomerase
MLFSVRGRRPDGAFSSMNRAGLLLLVSTLALAAVLAGCGGGDSGPKAVPDDAVAIVGDDQITRSEFDAMLSATLKGYAAQSRDVPQSGTKAYSDLRNRVLDDFVQESEFEQRAKSELHIEVSDAQVQQKVDRLKSQFYNGSQAEYVAGLRSQGLSDLQMRQRFRAELLADTVFAKLSSKVTVPDDDAKAYYDAHRKGYRHPATREVRQISVATRAEADRIERKLRGGADFAELARSFSTDATSASEGGRITFTRGQTLPALLDAAFPLKIGAVSPPVHTVNGWHIIEATGPLKPDSVTPFEQVKPTIDALLLQQARQARMTAWVKDVRTEFAKKTAYAPGFRPLARNTAAASAGD